jgi:hypothetical protein
VDETAFSSKLLREAIFPKNISFPKIILLDNYDHRRYFANINKIVSVRNKTGLLRLLYGDVYTAERRVRFGLSESDRCRRCFDKETILHLLMDCPYSKTVLKLMKIESDNIEDILGINLNKK